MHFFDILQQHATMQLIDATASVDQFHSSAVGSYRAETQKLFVPPATFQSWQKEDGNTYHLPTGVLYFDLQFWPKKLGSYKRPPVLLMKNTRLTTLPLPPVCPSKSSPCVPAPRAQVERCVRMVPVHTGRVDWTHGYFQRVTHHTPHTTHTTHNTRHKTHTTHNSQLTTIHRNSNNTQQHTETETERETERDRERRQRTREEKTIEER